MLVLITSCGRHDLLKQTITSLIKDIPYHLNIVVNEDMSNATEKDKQNLFEACNRFVNTFCFTDGLKQHGSIEYFLKMFPDEKYYLHLEEDWIFNNHYDWITASIEIMELDKSIIKVLCREDSQHPCKHNYICNGNRFGYLQRDWHHEGITWQGFSWNPGVTRLDLLKTLVPFRKWEGDVAEDVANAGYKVAELAKKVYKHIGYNRSTHD